MLIWSVILEWSDIVVHHDKNSELWSVFIIFEIFVLNFAIIHNFQIKL